MAIVIDTQTQEVFTVEEVEPGVFQSVFPKRLAEHSQLHTSELEAWQYIASVLAELL
jgi:hypothetical protein